MSMVQVFRRDKVISLYINMWQSWVENEHYSISMKIAFSTSFYALAHCLHSSQLLAPLCMCMCAMTYGP